MNNAATIVEREIASGNIEGVHFGPKIWVIARSPTAVLAWVYGSSYWSAGWSHYAPGYLALLEDRTPRFMYHPTHKKFQLPDNRIARLLELPADDLVKIGGALGLEIGDGALLMRAIRERKTLIVLDGGGQLRPLNLYGDAYREWRSRGGGFIVYPEGNDRV